MIGRTHDLAAITALGAVVLVGPPRTMTVATALVAVVANQFGGIAPDIDQPTAPFWRNLPVGGVFGKVLSRTLGGHRFLSHSVLGLAIFGGLVRLLLNFLQPIMPHVNGGYVWWAFMIGMLSHLVMDTITKEGVPWLLPIPVKFGLPPMKSLRVTTDKKLERLIIFPGLLLLDVIYCANHYPALVALFHQRLL